MAGVLVLAAVSGALGILVALAVLAVLAVLAMLAVLAAFAGLVPRAELAGVVAGLRGLAVLGWQRPEVLIRTPGVTAPGVASAGMRDDPGIPERSRVLEAAWIPRPERISGPA